MNENMNENIKLIQEKLMISLDRLDKAKDNISEEVARSNAISKIAITYIHTCNLSIRLEESKRNVFKNNIMGLLNEKK